MIYKKNDSVYVRLPGGEQKGRVMEVLHNYGFKGSKETKYMVDGDEFTTITSERTMRVANA